MKRLLDPLLFNYIILTLYALNASQFAARAAYYESSKFASHSLYWVFAFGITAVVTWGKLR